MWRALVLLVAVPAVACTIVLPHFDTGSDFAVTFRRGQHPVAGLRVALRSSFYDHVIEATTNADGVAEFRGVPEGAYSLVGESRHRGLAGVSVNAGRPLTRPEHIAVGWPAESVPIVARALRGSIRAANTLPPEERTMTAELDISANGRRVRTVRLAAGQRQFDLRTLPPGGYALTLREGSETLGPVYVKVDPGAETESFDLVVGASSCGTWVHNRATCPQAPLRLSRLAGGVTDAMGARVPGALVLLLDTAQTELARLQADERGCFSSPVPLRAGLWLAVYSPGFSPLRVQIGAVSLASAAELTAELGVMGACGRAIEGAR